MASEPGTLVLGYAQGARRWFLCGRSLSGGDVVQLCCSGGWITGRFEWGAEMSGKPFFHFSIEVEGGKVAEQSLAIPDGALMRWR